MSAQLKQGENFILNLNLANSNDNTPIPAADFTSFTIRALNQGKVNKSWAWLPANAGDPHIVITNGLAQLEVESNITAQWLGHISFEILPGFLNADYFVSGSQTDVVCFEQLVEFIKC